MKANRGQVAIYLVMVLVAIAFLTMGSVSAFLAVRAKNRTTNAGDAAALAVAKYQGELLNDIGDMNLAHLKCLLECKHIKDEPTEERLARMEACRDACKAIYEAQRRICFLDPIDGITIGNKYASDNGMSDNDAMREILKQHVIDVRKYYIPNPEVYPPPWEGAWEEYAERLEAALGGIIVAGPDNVEFAYAAHDHILLNKQFYNAVVGENWCWFHFNAPGLLDSYSGYRSWPPLPQADEETRKSRCINCEIYSLQLEPRIGGALTLFGKEIIMHLTNCTEQDIEDSLMIDDVDPRSTSWFCYGEKWDAWSTYPYINFNPNDFPIVGEVKPEYDVLGCAAVCRVSSTFLNLIAEEDRSIEWFAAAKPFGTVEGLGGADEKVTAFNDLVTPAFTETRLVPVDSVGGRDLSTADADWMTHVHDHLPNYMSSGISALFSGCYYCGALQQWELPSLRKKGSDWLKNHSGTCVRSSGGGVAYGGTNHAH